MGGIEVKYVAVQVVQGGAGGGVCFRDLHLLYVLLFLQFVIEGPGVHGLLGHLEGRVRGGRRRRRVRRRKRRRRRRRGVMRRKK